MRVLVKLNTWKKKAGATPAIKVSKKLVQAIKCPAFDAMVETAELNRYRELIKDWWRTLPRWKMHLDFAENAMKVMSIKSAAQ